MLPLCLLLSLSTGPDTMGPAPALTMIDDDSPTEIIATLSDARFPETAIDEMRAISARIDALAGAAEREVLAAARCASGAGCGARLDDAVLRLQCVDGAQRRARGALESSERAISALRDAERDGHPDLAIIQQVEQTKVRVALDRARQSGVDVSACVGEPSLSLTVSYR